MAIRLIVGSIATLLLASGFAAYGALLILDSGIDSLTVYAAGGIVHFAEVEAAARAAEQAVGLFRRGDVEAAKAFALEALKHLGG